MRVQTLRRSLAAAVLLAAISAPPLLAQPATAPAATAPAAAAPAATAAPAPPPAEHPPMRMPVASHTYKAAPAGTYAIDPGHTGIITRVSHIGFSYEVFRFRTVSGELVWDPANPAASRLNVTVDPKSITTAPTGNVDFAAELASPMFLNVAKFPTATFVSKAFHVLSPTHGKVDGDLTIMGKVIPTTFDVVLVGAGQGFQAPVIGVTARAMVPAVGLGLPAMFTAPIELIIDTEFDKKS